MSAAASDPALAGLLIAHAEPRDAGELLTLQRAAYVTEAQLHDDPMLPPLLETLDELLAAMAGATMLKAMLGTRIVGAIRGRSEDATLHVGRTAVTPDLQGRGIGTRLIAAIEATAGPHVERFELFTGGCSAANLRLYERLGYRELRREAAGPRVTLVFLEKRRKRHA
jgi:GNAT superfamily N-acetyltransferase